MSAQLEIRSFRSVFALERRIYRIDTLRLNPAGVPLRGIAYAVALVLLALVGGAVPPTAWLDPWRRGTCATLASRSPWRPAWRATDRRSAAAPRRAIDSRLRARRPPLERVRRRAARSAVAAGRGPLDPGRLGRALSRAALPRPGRGARAAPAPARGVAPRSRASRSRCTRSTGGRRRTTVLELAPGAVLEVRPR